MRGISSLGEEILASQERLCSKELLGTDFLNTQLLTLLTHSLTHSSSTQTSLHANHRLVLPNLTTKLENVRNIKIQSAVFMLLHVNTQKNKTYFMPRTLLFIILLFVKQLNKIDRTCQNCYARMHILTCFSYACSWYWKLKFCTHHYSKFWMMCQHEIWSALRYISRKQTVLNHNESPVWHLCLSTDANSDSVSQHRRNGEKNQSKWIIHCAWGDV